MSITESCDDVTARLMNSQSDISTLNHIFFHSTEHFSHACLLSRYEDGLRIDFSTEKFKQAVLAFARYLQTEDYSEGDRVAILSENRPEWHVSDFAILLSRLIVVPVYPTFSPAQMEYLLSHSGCSVLVLSGRQLWEKVHPFLDDLPNLRTVITMDKWKGCEDDVISLTDIMAEKPDDNWVAKAQARALSTDTDSVATIVYTSGTTGTPKGVMLTHANIAFDLKQCLRRLSFQTTNQALSVLPLSHSFERLLCYGYFQQGVPIASGDPYALSDLFKQYHPEAMGCVPRILERIYESVMREIESLPAWKRSVSRFLVKIGLTHIEKEIARERLRYCTAPAKWLADLLLFSRIRRRLGGRLRYIICGGARLDVNLEKFLLAAGFSVIQGYGLTETSPVISLSPLGQVRLGTVGKPLDQVQVSFSEEGELLTSGAHVMKGYYNDPQGTKDVSRSSWLMTGDLGKLDEDGYLIVSERKKEILITSVGENIPPAPIEDTLCRSPFIERAILVGEGRKFISAFIVPHREHLIKHAQSKRIPFHSLQDLLQSPAIISLYSAEIEIHLNQFSEYEKVKEFCFLEEEALRDPDLVTPTQKIRRNILERKYRSRVDEMYRQR